MILFAKCIIHNYSHLFIVRNEVFKLGLHRNIMGLNYFENIVILP